MGTAGVTVISGYQRCFAAVCDDPIVTLTLGGIPRLTEVGIVGIWRIQSNA